MALPTSTRAELRRAICGELGMEFFRRYPAYLTCDSGSTTTMIKDSDLTQADDAWKNMWFYISANVSTSTGATLDDNVGEVRLIDTFSNIDNALTLDRGLPQAATKYDRYEIHDVWNAYEIHNAINRAIRDGMPDFFDVITDETLALKEDTLEYDISSLTYRPWIVSEVWIERPHNSVTGTVTSAASTTLVDTSANFSNVNTKYKVSIYDGTGSGQLRAVTSITGTTQLNVAAWTTTPDSTSKYRVWDATEHKENWYRLTSARLDKQEYPSKLYLPRLYSDLYGARMRIIYATDALELTSDLGTTAVPKEFVIYKAIEFLAASRVVSPKVDREHYATLEQMYASKAETYRMRHGFRMDTTLWQEQDYGRPSGISRNGDPLNWL